MIDLCSLRVLCCSFYLVIGSVAMVIRFLMGDI